MQNYRFVGGGECEVAEKKYNQFGKVARFDANTAIDVIQGRGVFIPEPDFDAIGFSQADLAAINKTPWKMTPELHEKKARAQQIYRDLLASLQ